MNRLQQLRRDAVADTLGGEAGTKAVHKQQRVAERAGSASVQPSQSMAEQMCIRRGDRR